MNYASARIRAVTLRRRRSKRETVGNDLFMAGDIRPAPEAVNYQDFRAKLWTSWFCRFDGIVEGGGADSTSSNAPESATLHMDKAVAKTAKSSKTPDLFADAPAARRNGGARSAPTRAVGDAGYTAKHIEVLEGLEPVRRRPGMYIGGTDEKALHHLFAEVIDNAMDEALAGHADWIEVELAADGFLTVTDNGRGIPVDPHPKFKNKSALEVIMCTLHAGGKFDSEVYETSGGLHGVGVSVANALSERMEVEVARGQKLYRMVFERGKPKGKLQDAGKAPNRRGTKVRFRPDPEIFGPNP